MAKITIVGAGLLGSQAAFLCMMRDLGSIVLLDVIEGLPQGKALDIMQAAPLTGNDASVTGTNDYSKTKDSDVVVITAGIARKPGMSREELLLTNTKIVQSVTSEIVKYSPECVIVVVTNPMDMMAYVCWKASGFPKERVVGMGGVLDSSRMRFFVGEKVGVPGTDVEATVVGSHSDNMIPLRASFEGKEIQLDEIILEKTKNAGAEVIGLQKQSTCFAPAASITETVDAIVNDKKKVLPCSVFFKEVFIGMPVVLGKKGVEKIVEVDLNSDEKIKFEESIKTLKDRIENI